MGVLILNDNFSAYNSDNYDDEIKRTLPYYEEFYNQITDVVNSFKPSTLKLTWLDVGCGTGKMAEVAFKRANINRFVFCDCSEEMLEIAQSRFEFPNTNFIVSRAEELEFHNTFDVVTAIQVNHYLNKEERIRAIEKCYNALKKDGMFISFENFAPNSELGKQLYLNRWKSFQQEQGKSSSQSESHIKRYNKDYFPISIPEHLKVMEDCGFKAVEILWLSYMQVGLLGIK